MVKDLNLDVEIVVCPIVREADGLALSSRNAYLRADERKAATVLYRALVAARREIAAGRRDSLELLRAMRKEFQGEPLATVNYAEIVDAGSFEPVVRVSGPSYALLAVYIGKTRLIDNMLIEPAGEELAATI
jgi:pantoate--beta-alanine ligase